MKILITDIKIALNEEFQEIRNIVAKKLKISEREILSIKIIKESIDARKKTEIYLVYSVLVTLKRVIRIPRNNKIKLFEDVQEVPIIPGNKELSSRPVIVGSGPAGLFAGLILAQNGYRPLIFERGESMQNRIKIVERYWNDGILDSETNVQFGEGGAGTFSDGKLTTRINDYRCDRVLKELYRFGASEEILFKAKPHIGSNVFHKVIVNMRKKIEELGGEIRFNSKLTSLRICDGKIYSAIINETDEINAKILVLAIGHSARDTFEMLLKQGVSICQKPFSLGVRIEHPREMINKAQYGIFAAHNKLGAADYQLFHKVKDRCIYTFCMCPGGVVVASASEEGGIVTNGMSELERDKENSNSAFVVSVGANDFDSSHPLAGVEFQRKWERKAFLLGGGNAAPVQRLGDFVDGVESGRLGSVKPSYTGKFKVCNINSCLPMFVSDAMKESLGYFDRKIEGFYMKDAVLTGVETRTSSPIKIQRNDLFEAVDIEGLYPAGEGAGYAGGIMSAAVDGIKVAEKIMCTYKLPK